MAYYSLGRIREFRYLSKLAYTVAAAVVYLILSLDRLKLELSIKPNLSGIRQGSNSLAVARGTRFIEKARVRDLRRLEVSSNDRDSCFLQTVLGLSSYHAGLERHGCLGQLRFVDAV